MSAGERQRKPNTGANRVHQPIAGRQIDRQNAERMVRCAPQNFTDNGRTVHNLICHVAA